jgi:hypothetical protein
MSRNCRRYNEGCAASLLLAGINLSLAIGALTNNRGSFRAALDRIGALEEWSVGCLVVACLLVWGVLHPTTRARYWSLIVASIWSAASYVSVIFLAPHLATAPFGNTILFSAATAYALFWLHIRNEAHSSHVRSTNAG